MGREILSVEAFYNEGKKGKLKGLRCDAGHITVPARHSCRVCQSTNLQVVDLSGIGNLVSFTEVYAKSADFPLVTPYVLGLVALEEGGNLLGVLRTGNPAKVAFGAMVRVKFETVPGPLPPINTEKERPRIFFDLV